MCHRRAGRIGALVDQVRCNDLQIGAEQLDLPRQLAGDHYAPGNALHWDGTDEQHRDGGSGVYLVQLRVGGFRDTARLVLLR